MEPHAFQRLTLDEIDVRFEHRVGWPRLTPAPVYTLEVKPSDPQVVNVEMLRPRICQILDRHQIVHHEIDLQYRTPIRHAADLPREFVRLLINCKYDPRKREEYPDSWATAVIEIHGLLLETANQHELLDLGIELFDLNYEHSIHLTNVPEKYQHVVENWDGGNQYRRQVLALFANRPRLWQAMLLTGLQASNKHTRDQKCVLWFDAIDTNNQLRLQVETELRSILPPDVSIEIWQASHRLLSFSTPGTFDASPILDDSSDLKAMPDFRRSFLNEHFEWPPNPGCSIGAVGEESGSGTLGGYVKVLEDTVDAHGNSTSCERVYALTCAHVALSGSRGVSSQNQVHESI